MKSLSQGHAGRAGLSPGALFLCGRPGAESVLPLRSPGWGPRLTAGTSEANSSRTRLAPGLRSPWPRVMVSLPVPGLALPCRAAVSTRPLPLPLLRPKPPFPAGISWLRASLKFQATRPFKGA